jgi:hypothetical protein
MSSKRKYQLNQAIRFKTSPYSSLRPGTIVGVLDGPLYQVQSAVSGTVYVVHVYRIYPIALNVPNAQVSWEILNEQVKKYSLRHRVKPNPHQDGVDNWE